MRRDQLNINILVCLLMIQDIGDIDRETKNRKRSDVKRYSIVPVVTEY